MEYARSTLLVHSLQEDREHARLKRDSLVLVLDFLAQNGYVDSLTRLQAESGVSLQKWQVSSHYFRIAMPFV